MSVSFMPVLDVYAEKDIIFTCNAVIVLSIYLAHSFMFLQKIAFHMHLKVLSLSFSLVSCDVIVL